MLITGERKAGSSSAVSKIQCETCGIAFETDMEKQKHIELEHKKNAKPAGVG